MDLRGKTITIGLTACTPVDQIPALMRELRKQGAALKVTLTPSTLNFITPLVLSRAANCAVDIDMFKDPAVWDAGHRSIAETDLLLIAPASANTIGKAANGIADNLLTTTILSTAAPIVFSPHMSPNMYAQKSVQRNIQTLKEDGVLFIDNHQGRPGSMPGNDIILQAIKDILL